MTEEEGRETPHLQKARDDLTAGDIVRANGQKYVFEGWIRQSGVSELGDRRLSECPVDEGDFCIDPDCDGRIGEKERDEETQSAHELYCYGCGLNWVDRTGDWEETYADWPTSFFYGGGDNGE